MLSISSTASCLIMPFVIVHKLSCLGLRVPVRPAPAPPPSQPAGFSVAKASLNLMDSWERYTAYG